MCIRDRIDEAQMDAVVSVNGSSPAFLYYFADIVARHAAERGIEEKTALALFCQTMIGSAKMLMESGHTPEELITMAVSYTHLISGSRASAALYPSS